MGAKKIAGLILSVIVGCGTVLGVWTGIQHLDDRYAKSQTVNIKISQLQKKVIKTFKDFRAWDRYNQVSLLIVQVQLMMEKDPNNPKLKQYYNELVEQKRKWANMLETVHQPGSQ